ncbi:MAG: prepilin-type N-terminal cleavage/methylation domain-containing protein [Lachnospirales bacterium]
MKKMKRTKKKKTKRTKEIERKSFAYEKGVTLVEVLVVVGIILILASIVTPKVFAYYSDAEEVKREGDFAQVYAWSKTGYKDWKMQDTSNTLLPYMSYNISLGTSTQPAGDTTSKAIREKVDFYVSGDYKLGDAKTDTENYSVVIKANSRGNLDSITVTQNGWVSTNGLPPVKSELASN